MTGTNEGRNVLLVIGKIIKCIAENEVILIDELQKYSDSLWNQSPEAVKSKYCWKQFINILNCHIPIISKNWHSTIKDIIIIDN